jgi:DNA-binding NtrC family response regulator
MSGPKGQIVVIDDDDGNRKSIEMALRKDGYLVTSFSSGPHGLEHLKENGADLVVTDLRMPGMDGLEVLKVSKLVDPGLAVLVITGFGSVESAVDAMKQGADDYLQKPVNLVELRKRVAAAVEKRRLAQEVRLLRERLEEKFSFGTLVGTSKAMQQVLHQLALVAPTRSSVLIIGESGTGKELIANALHQNSPRKDLRFLPINCAAIPADILESELFGHERGAFTGAVQRKAGKFELADRGTLFLDEIGDMPLALQAKLLRVLEDRSFMRVGGSDTISVDVRIIAATNSNLEAKVAAGAFRSDLYYRLKVVTIEIPPLRERSEDIPLLTHRFFEAFKAENNRPNLQLAPEVMEILTRARWEGNVRELRNLMESLVILAGDDTRMITREHLPENYRTPQAPAAPPRPEAAQPRTMEEIEKEAILKTLQQTGGNRTRAADLLGIGLRTLQRKLREYEQGPGEGHSAEE